LAYPEQRTLSLKRFVLLFLMALAFAGFLPFAACDKHAVDTPMPPPTLTPTNTPVLVLVTIAGNLYSPAPVTIAAGAGVIWNNTDPYSHTFNYTNGGTTCVNTSPIYINPGNSVTVLFPTPGTNYIHCDFHSNCSFVTSCDASCEGPGLEAMEVVVQ
jgi:plastocyanin